MITVKLFGRLGNQLFQLCTCLAFAKRHNIKFAIPQRITCPPGLASDPIYFTHFPKPDFDIDMLPEWKEPADQSYMEIPAALSGAPFCLNGYFQSEKYFADQRGHIFDAFPMLLVPMNEFKNDMVSIHVRRGDYLDKPLDHPLPSLAYYSDGIEYFIKNGFRKFMVFSDDIKWCKVFFTKEIFEAQFFFSEKKSAIEDLKLMASCRHHIIANSSFSWWGSWLGRRERKVVIAPKIWYGPNLSHIDTKDLIPENWIRL